MGGITMITLDLKRQLSRTPAGRKILPFLKGDETTELLLGKKKTSGKAKWKKIGKFTSKFTEKIAKVAAATVGIPPSAIDALKKFDPTTKKKLDAALLDTPAAAAAAASEQEKATAAKNKKMLIIGGAAAVTGIVILLATKKKGN
jgi:hypothetical protein